MMKKLEDMRVVDLRAELDKRGLDKTGIKAVLIERLKKSIQSDGGNPDEFEVSNQSRNNINKSMLDDEQDSIIEPDSNDDVKEPSDGGSENIGTRKSLIRTRESSLPKKEPKVEEEVVNASNNEEAKEVVDMKSDVDVKSDSKKDSRHIEIKDVYEENDIEEITLEDEDSQDVEDEIMDEEETGGNGLATEEYNRRMEDESINLMLEDDDKMLDYEENDRIDMEEVSNADGKEKEEGTSVSGGSTTGTPSKKDSSVLQDKDKSENDNAKSSKGQEETKENDEKKNKNGAASGSSRNLWVSGLASNTRAQDLKTLFSKHGKVLSAKIVTNAKTPGAKCFGFVTMSTLDDANKCISYLNRTELHGRMIQVEKAKGEPGGPKPQPPTSKSGGSTQSKDSASSNERKEGEKPRSGDPSSHPRRDPIRKEGDARGKGAPERRERDRGGKASPHSRLANRGGPQERERGDRDRERDRRSKSDARKLSAKDRVVDRRHEKNGPFSKSRAKRSPQRGDVLSFNRQSVVLAGNSVAAAFGDHPGLAVDKGLDLDTHFWPEESFDNILQNLRTVVKDDHKVVLIFALTYEAWQFVPFMENQAEPRVLIPNDNLSLENIVKKMDSFVKHCKKVNSAMKVILVIPPVYDMFAYNKSRVAKFDPTLVQNLDNSMDFNKNKMNEHSRSVYSKITTLLSAKCTWADKHTISCQNVRNMMGPSGVAQAVDGLHPSEDFIAEFWDRYSNMFNPSAEQVDVRHKLAAKRATVKNAKKMQKKASNSAPPPAPQFPAKRAVLQTKNKPLLTVQVNKLKRKLEPQQEHFPVELRKRDTGKIFGNQRQQQKFQKNQKQLPKFQKNVMKNQKQQNVFPRKFSNQRKPVVSQAPRQQQQIFPARNKFAQEKGSNTAPPVRRVVIFDDSLQGEAMPHSMPMQGKVVLSNPMKNRGMMQKTIQNKPQNIIQNKPQHLMQNRPQPLMQNRPQPLMQNRPQPLMQNRPQPLMQNRPQPLMQNSPQPLIQNRPEPFQTQDREPQHQFMQTMPEPLFQRQDPEPQRQFAQNQREFERTPLLTPNAMTNSDVPQPAYSKPFFMSSELPSSSTDDNYIVQERERQRLRTRERLMREEERMRRDEEMQLRDLERRQKMEAQKIIREREKLRIERERVERQKQELLRLEREHQRIEREKLERERDELRKQQMKYEEVRRGVKRPAPAPADRDRREFFDDRKRPASERLPPGRGAADRGNDRGLHRGPERGGIIRGSDRGGPDRGGSLRGPERASDRGPVRGSDRGNRYAEEPRETRYDRHSGGDRVPQIRSGGSYDDRRQERDDRRPIVDRSVSRGDARDHHRTSGPPPISMRERPPQRDSHYNGGGMSNMSGGSSWHPGSHSSKSSGPTYGSNPPSMMGVSGTSVSGRSGVDSQGAWRPGSGSVSMSTNERWGGGSSSAIGGRSNSMMDILRSADSYHMGGGQVPVNTVPLMSNMSQGDRFGSMGNFRK